MPVQAGQPERIEEPQLTGDELAESKFGDDEAVSLLGELLDDDDPLVRERAVADLGQTHNPAALTYLRRAMQDGETSVRVTAVLSAAELGDSGARRIVIQALDGKDSAVLLAALGSVRKLQLAAAAEKLPRLLALQDPFVRAVALETLTELKIAAAPSDLKTLLSDPSPRVRLRAAENALLVKNADSILSELTQAAGGSNPPAVRSAAIEALGKHTFETSGLLLSQAAQQTNPLVRRGAVRGYHHAGEPQHVAAFLTDNSPVVRLPAVRAAGDLKMTESVGRLLQIMLEATDPQIHMAARDALGEIGTPAVAKAAAEALVKLTPPLLEIDARPPPRKKGAKRSPPPARAESKIRDDPRQRMLVRRNATACCWLLGSLKSKEGYQHQLELLTKLQIDSQVLETLVPGLARIGDRRAVKPLLETLKVCVKAGRRALRAMARDRTPPPFSEEITGQICQALGDLKAYETLDTILEVIRTDVMGMRLNVASARATDALLPLVQPTNQSKIEGVLINVLSDDRFALLAKFYAAKAVGKLGCQAALPDLRKLLTEIRPGWKTMYACAWAIQEITSTTPNIPKPRINQGEWIIKKLQGR